MAEWQPTISSIVHRVSPGDVSRDRSAAFRSEYIESGAESVERFRVDTRRVELGLQRLQRHCRVLGTVDET